MTQLHAALGPVVLLLLIGLAGGASVAAVRDRAPGALETVRRVLLAIIVAEAAIGLALAARGGAPAEWIHWAYGIVIVAGLLLPGMLRADLPAGRRSTVLAVASAFAAVIAWRLGASG